MAETTSAAGSRRAAPTPSSPPTTGAVCFVTGEPSGLTTTLPPALAELTKAAGPAAKIMLGFDRGGAHPQVFRQLQRPGRALGHLPPRPARGPGPPAGPCHHHPRRAAPADQLGRGDVQLTDYGEARQITLFEQGVVALQILTSDTSACPAEILVWLKSRWREKNCLKYAAASYGIDAICDYIAHRLSQHGRLDPAHSPAEHAEPVDHRGVGVGADERVRVGQRAVTARAAGSGRASACRKRPALPASPG